MSRILVIETSPLRSQSFSNQLARKIIEELRAKDPKAELVTRDLIANPPSMLTNLDFGAYSDEAIAELMDADTIIFSVPVHNFSIPGVMKAYIDQIARAGKTFSYTAAGPEGLVKNKKVYLAIASGAIMSTGPYQVYDFAEPYLRAILGFIGMKDITVFRVEGVAIPGVKETALEKAFAGVHV